VRHFRRFPAPSAADRGAPKSRAGRGESLKQAKRDKKRDTAMKPTTIGILAAAAVIAAFLIGSQLDVDRDTPAEEMGDAVEGAAEEMGNAADDAAEQIGDAAEGAAEEVEGN